MLEAGVWVRCIDVKPGRVIVRKLEVPPEALEDLPPADKPSASTVANPPAASSAKDSMAPSPPGQPRPGGEDLDLDLDLR